MPTYNLKRESKLYLVLGGIRYQLDVYPDLSFSQTFDEVAVPVKTLHDQFSMFENAVITKANPANFSFTTPIILEADLDVVLNMLLQYDNTSDEATLKTADLYVVSNTETYKLEKAVFESATFGIQKDAPLTMQVSGTARKLSKFVGTVPGTPFARASSRTFTAVTSMNVAIGGVTQDSITSVSFELKNDVKWVDFATLQDSLVVSDASGTMFPGAFAVSSRAISGVIQQYVTDTRNNVNTWVNGSALNVQVGNLGSSYTIEFLLPQVIYTNRLEVQDLIIQSYDFRLVNNNTTTLSNVIKKRSI